MAYSENIQTITLEAGSDLSSKQFYFVTLQSDKQLDTTGDGNFATGVLQNDPSAAGRSGEVAIGGVCKVACGGNVTAGSDVASTSSGTAIDAVSGDEILGQALQGGTSGQIVSILFNPRGTA